MTTVSTRSKVWRACARASRACMALVLLAACGEQRADGGEAVSMRDSSGVVLVDQDISQLTGSCVLDATPSVSIGVEEGAEEYMLTQVNGAARLSDGRIVIAERPAKELRYYSAEGVFIRSAGRGGQGPGEFSNPFYLNVMPGDTVYAGDYRPWQFLVFDPDGNWVRTVRPEPVVPNPPSPERVLANGQLILGERAFSGVEPPESFPMRYTTLRRFSADGAFLDTLGRYPNARYGQVNPSEGAPFTSPLFESFGQITARGARVVIAHGSASELRLHRSDSAFSLERIVRWTDGSRDITSADVAAERDAIRARGASMPPEQFAALVEPQLSDRRPVAEQFPAFTEVQIGTDDRMWVLAYARVRDSVATRRWTAFDTEGRFDCRLETPRFAQVYEFGRDYMLVREEDSLGVARVRMYGVRKQ